MPLGKADNPKSTKAAAAAADTTPDTYLDADDPKTKEAVDDLLDEGAGAPDSWDKDVEALPEKDDVQKATKEAMQADTGQEEAQAKADAVAGSPDAPDTPSGGALEATKGIADNVERGEAYAREKAMRRWGYVTPDLQEKK